MRVFPNAKINIGLYVTEKRTDGFHNLETVFYPIAMKDILEVSQEEGPKGLCYMENTGITVDCPDDKNLIVKAYKLLASAYDLPAVRVNLHKTIPYGAGLGGGSSDAAFMLKALNEYFELKISERGLCNFAARLGSDCAFFIQDQPAFATGRGEVLENIGLSLEDYELVVVKPDCIVPTAEAYAGVTPDKAGFDLRTLTDIPVCEWRKFIQNDFEKTVFIRYPEIRQVKDDLYSQGALYASMTGSGSGVFAVFKKGKAVTDIVKADFVWREDKEKGE